MNKKLYIKDVSFGMTVDDFFLLKTLTERETRAGKPYFQLEIADRTGSIKGVKWDVGVHEKDLFKVGDIVETVGNIRTYNEELQFVCQAMKTCESGRFSFEDFIPASRIDSKELKEGIFKILDTVKNPDLKRLIQVYKEDSDLMQLFFKAPAAKDFHHAYISGLAEHVLSCLQLTKLICSHYHQLDKDLLLAGVFLHDIGKVHELNFQGAFDYTQEGRFLGHIAIASEMLAEKIQAMDRFPKELGWRLKHLILSHHGEFEYGSPVLPKTMEAQVLHYIDNLDAKVNMFDCANEKGYASTNGWVFSRPLGRHILSSEPSKAAASK